MVDKLVGKTAFVTGADGFIGSHLVELLVEKGFKVKALVAYNSWNSKGWLEDVDPAVLDQVELLPGDIRDKERINEGVRGAEYVFHLSSLIAIPYSYHAPRSYVDTNIIGVMNVLESCRDSESLVRMVHVSTSEVYGSAQFVPITEAHPLVGQSPYSASKIGADKMAESYFLSFGLPVVTARPFNTFGPRQTARAVIPTIASQLVAGCDQLELGALTPTRDFNFVKDTARGMLALGLSKEAEGEVVNISTNTEWSIEQTAKMLMEVTGREVPIKCDEARIRPEKSEVNRLLGCNKKITGLTDWSRSHSFKDGLTDTVEWIGKNIQFFDPERYTL